QAVGGRIETGDLAQHVDAEDHLVEAVPANQGKQQRDGQDHAEAESELATDAQIAKPTFHESSPGYSLSARTAGAESWRQLSAFCAGGIGCAERCFHEVRYAEQGFGSAAGHKKNAAKRGVPDAGSDGE